MKKLKINNLASWSNTGAYLRHDRSEGNGVPVTEIEWAAATKFVQDYSQVRRWR